MGCYTTSIIPGANQSFDEVIMYSTFSEVSYLVLWHPDSLVRSEPGNRRPEPDTESCSPWSRYTGDSNTDLWDYSKVRAGSRSETRQRFSFKIASFHVSIYSYVYLDLLLSICVYRLLLSFHMTFCHILPVRLPVPFHMTSVTINLKYFVDTSMFWCHLMCWYFAVVGLGLVLIQLRL